jgi:hypothetical protein
LNEYFFDMTRGAAPVNGAFLAGDGFGLNPNALERTPSQPIYTRSDGRRQAPRFALPANVDAKMVKRVMDGGDLGQLLALTGMSAADLQRAITTQTTGFPVRENLEAVAKILVPMDTPLRNRVPRVSGSGTAAQWRTIISLGGGYAGATTTTGALVANTTTVVPVVSAAGFAPGDTLAIDSGTLQEYKIIASIAAANITLTSAVSSAHASGIVIGKYGVQPGSSATGAIQAFYAETGAPGQHSTVYQPNSLGYKLMGALGSVSGFAMAAGASFQNQLAVEKRNSVLNTMLNEENALINGNASSILAPWGDGTNNLAYNGLLNLISTANGTPPDQVQVNVGALTTAHIDSQLKRLYNQGARDPWILCSPQEVLSLTHLAEGAGSIIRVQATAAGQAVLGIKLNGYVHPVTGEIVPIMPSRFLSPGYMIFGCDTLPDGNPSLQVDVLPQTQLPSLAPNTMVQGYVAQEIAPTLASPQVYPFIVSVFSVLKMKSYLHFALSTGLTAV